jgi:hypothetical protein
MKRILIAAVAICALLAVDANAQGLGGAVAFNRSFVRLDGETTDLTSAVPGLSFIVPMNQEKDEAGKITKKGTWGLSFATAVLQDSEEGVTINTVIADGWYDWRAVKLLGGMKLDFTDESTILPEKTNLFGFNAAIRFPVGAVPAEFGGSWSTSYDGVDNVNISGVYLGLVSDIWGSGTSAPE